MRNLLNRIEKAVNKLPDPTFLFGLLAILVLIFSWIGSVVGFSAIHPGTKELITVKNLLTVEEFRHMLTSAVKNFIEFPPLGLVIVTMLGVGVAEKSGFFSVALSKLITLVPNWASTATLIFASVISHIMGDACVIIMPALGAMLFAGLGRNPLVGLTAAFVGACGGLSANIILTAIDPLLSGFTESAAQMVDKSYKVLPTANYYFMFFSSFVVTAGGTFVATKIVEPKLGKWSPSHNVSPEDIIVKEIGKREKKGLIYSIIALGVLIFLLLLAIIPENGLLRNEKGSLMPLYQSIIPIIMIVFLITGVVYGKIAGTIKTSKDLVVMLNDSIAMISSYIVLAFVASQFLAYFNWSNLGIVMAVNGANFLKSIGLQGVPLLISFLLFVMFINLFVTSASAKWAVISPIFVPMMMIVGYSPETTQAIFRTGDSITNIVTPLLPYFPIILVIARKYEPELSFGKLISTLFPYSIVLFFLWGTILILWIVLGIPLGPETQIYYHLK